MHSVDAIRAILAADAIDERDNAASFIADYAHLENQATRGSIYVYEQATKVLAARRSLGLPAHEFLARLADDRLWQSVEAIDVVHDIEDAVAAGAGERRPVVARRVVERLERSYPYVLGEGSEENNTELVLGAVHEFHEAETKHPFVRCLLAPPLFPDERAYFRQAFEHLRHCETPGNVVSLDLQQYRSSRFVRAVALRAACSVF
jgi:hypothetical protein